MSSIIVCCFILLLLFISELIYFRLADHFNIIDKPNHRSSHTSVTIRGGGIIFPIAGLLWFAYTGYALPWFIVGLIVIATISFIDDVATLKSSVRSVVHLLAVALLLYQANLLLNWYYLALILILVVGTINAYNFMDGINGITGGYSFVLLLSLFFVNHFVVAFTSETLILFSLLSVLVFNFFNFRRKARCFAGDVGSVSIAFTICFLLIQLIAASGNLLYVAFLLVYGLDAVTTIFFRLIRRENITEAHRSHFYQYLANERKWPHLRVASLYAMVQLAVNALVIYHYRQTEPSELNFQLLILVLLVSGASFIALRLAIEGRERLSRRQRTSTGSV